VLPRGFYGSQLSRFLSEDEVTRIREKILPLRKSVGKAGKLSCDICGSDSMDDCKICVDWKLDVQNKAVVAQGLKCLCPSCVAIVEFEDLVENAFPDSEEGAESLQKIIDHFAKVHRKTEFEKVDDIISLQEVLSRAFGLKVILSSLPIGWNVRTNEPMETGKLTITKTISHLVDLEIKQLESKQEDKKGQKKTQKLGRMDKDDVKKTPKKTPKSTKKSRTRTPRKQVVSKTPSTEVKRRKRS
jgi:hypothetical protein